MFGLLSKLICTTATFLFPVFASYKALKANDPTQLQPWLMYWVVLAGVLFVESWTEWILVWFPFYSEIKAGFMLWLVLPQFQGATRIYLEYVHPTLEKHERDIEDFISRSHDRLTAAGLDYVKKLMLYIQEAVFGISPKPQAAPAPNETYAQNLLGRFRLANPVSVGGVPNDFFQFIGQALTGMSGTPATPQGATYASPFGNLNAASPAEQAGYIERLRDLLTSLERQQATRSSQQGSPATPGTPETIGSALHKTLSSTTLEDFENVQSSDAPIAGLTRKQSSGGGWLWGWKGSSSGSVPTVKGKDKEHTE